MDTWSCSTAAPEARADGVCEAKVSHVANPSFLAPQCRLCCFSLLFFLRNASRPTALTTETLALVDALRYTSHLHMYAMVSHLRFFALKYATVDKPWDILHGNVRPSMVMGARWILCECIDACFGSLSSDARLCQRRLGAAGDHYRSGAGARIPSWNKQGVERGAESVLCRAAV